MVVALPFIGLALTAISTGYGVVSSINQASAAKQSANYNSQVAQNNAAQAQMQSASDQQQIQRQNYLALSSQQASYGAAGVDFGAGTPLDVGLDSAIEGNYNLLARKYQGDVAANNYTAQSGLDQMQGENAATQDYSQIGTTLLTGAGSAVKQINTAFPQKSTSSINYGSSTSAPTFDFG